MAAKRRVTPSVDALGTPETVPVGGAARYNVVGAAGPPVGPNPLAQLSQSLRRFNPVLGQYAAAKQQMSAEEAAAYYDEIEKGVTDKEVAIKRHLQKIGAPHGANPAIYKHEIISTGANFAERDIRNVRSNPEFEADISQLAKNSTDFFNDAVDLFNNKYTPDAREQEDPKVGHYWEIGYGESWIKNRDKIIREYSAENEARREVSIKEAFFEDGRNQLVSAITSPNLKKGLNEFRTFLGKKYGGFPEDKLGYSQSVMDEVILPVFLDLASDPDNEINLAAAWSKITGMTRDNGNGGRTQLFSKYADISKQAGSQTVDMIWSTIADTEQKAGLFKDRQEARRIERVNKKVTSVLGNYDRWQEENADFLKEKNVHGLDIFDQRNVYKIADALAQHPDFQMSKKEADQTSNYIFADAIRNVQIKLLQNQAAYGKAKEGAREALMADLTEVANEQAIPLLEPLLPAVNDYIGKTDKSIDEVVHDVVYTFFNMDDMKAAVFKANPTLESQSLLFRNALQTALTTKLENGGKALGRAMLNQFRDAMNPANSGQYSAKDWIDMASQLQDVVDEIDDNDLEADINAAVTDLESFAELDSFYSVSDRDIENMVTSIMGSDAQDELATILAYARKTVAGDTFRMVNVDDTNIMAAKYAYARFTQEVFLPRLRQNTKKALEGLTPQERANVWAERLEGETQNKTIDQLKAEKNVILNFYEEALQRSDDEGLLDKEKLRRKLSDTNINILENFEELERQYHDDPVHGQGTAPEFFTGPKGLQRYSNLEEVRRDLDKSRDKLITDLYETSNALRQSEQRDTPTDQRRHVENFATAEKLYKNFVLAFDPLDWTQLNSETGQVLEVPTAGQTLKVKLDIKEDQINLNNSLVYSSLKEMAEVSEALDAWELEQGGADAEVDRESAPEDVKAHADFIRKTHGIDLLATEPTVRKMAHEAYVKLRDKQKGLINSRHTHLLPTGVRKDIEDRAIEEYIESDVTRFEGVEYNENVKQWVKGVYLQNQDIDKYNLEDGITQSEFMNLRNVLTGGEVNPRWYEIVTKANGTVFVDRDRSDIYEEKDTKAEPYQVIAQELALIDIGVFNPISSPQDGFFDEEGLNRFEMITPAKYERLQERQKYYEYLLIDDKPDKRPDLAKAFNRLLIAEKGYFQNRFKTENHFGITPLPIPHKQK